MKAAAAQITLSPSKGENLQKAINMIEKAKDSDLVVLPEMLMGKRTDETELYQLAENVEEGHFAKALALAAKENNITVCACLWEDSGSERVFNTAVVFSPEGKLISKYRKLHLFDAFTVKESDHMLRVESLPPVFNCGGVSCGLSICYDLRFPEIYRSLVKRGAELFVIPAAWYGGERKVEHMQTLLSARALENTSYSLISNVCGGDFCGNSATFAPFGEMTDNLGDDEGLLTCDISLKYLKQVRKTLPCLVNFRDDIL
ncbi:MAG: amidohydrolase [Denitrovibrio sp.]|nr:MAG: amidohydrolase [Denitrovibrio sp.]